MDCGLRFPHRLLVLGEGLSAEASSWSEDLPGPGWGWRGGLPMRVNVAAAAGAVLATVLAVVGDAVHPAQVVVSIAAAAAFLAVLGRGGRAAPGDWFTVQALLAGNLIVFGISDSHELGDAVALLVVVAGVLLVLATIWMYQRGPGARGRGR